MELSPLEAARKLAPQIRSCADEIEAQRELPRPLFEALADAGLFHMAVPASIGGGELDLPTYIQVIEELGKADASTAWCVNQGAIFATYAARMPREVARAIWIDPPRAWWPTRRRRPPRRWWSRAAIASPAARASAPAAATPPGWPRTRRSSRTARCGWRPTAAGDALHVRAGRRGRAARHLARPRHAGHRHPSLRGGRRLRAGGAHGALGDGAAAAKTGPLYRIPRTLLFASGDAAVALGMARACLERVHRAGRRQGPARHAGAAARSVDGPGDVGQCRGGLRAGQAFLNEAVREIWAAACAGAITLEQRAALRMATTHGIRLAAQIVDAVYNAAGATAVYEDNSCQRYFQDIHVITQHLQGRLAHYELVGRHWLGLAIDENRL